MKCRRCNRTLKIEPWASLGIGKICSSKQSMETTGQNQGDTDSIIAYDDGDIFMERVYAPTIGRDGQLSMEKHSASGIKTNIQRTVYKHSPTGFNFGYGGSGPADAALNICLMFTDAKTAQRIYQDFKWKFLSNGQEDKLIIPKKDIISFIEEAKQLIVQQDEIQ